MLLTLSKKFEFSASHRLYDSNLTDIENYEIYHNESKGKYGHGHNYTAYFSLSGNLDQNTGMIVNIVDVKKMIESFLMSRYDHKFLNEDTKPFNRIPPTAENIASNLLNEAAEEFKDSDAKPVTCHLIESQEKEATAYQGGKIESHYWINFSAARSTRSPRLNDSENEKLFGVASRKSGHGHNYRLRITLHGEIDQKTGLIVSESTVKKSLAEIFDKFDHMNLNTDLPEFEDNPTTTEMLAKTIFDIAQKELPVRRVKLFENDYFHVEYDGSDKIQMSVLNRFYAAHRLHSPFLNVNENIAIYDKCNNPAGHGHCYKLESTFSGELDHKTGTVANLSEILDAVKSVLEPWNYTHLNYDTDDFKNLVTTSENIINVLYDKLKNKTDNNLTRLRLWETNNNRFTLRINNG